VPLRTFDEQRLHGLLEMQFARHAMFVSCAWFFDDLDRILKNNGFARSQLRSGSSHYTYAHPDLPDILTIPLNQPFIKRPYVVDALHAIDTVQEIDAERGRNKQ